MTRLKVEIPQSALLTWESQARQYPARGGPGLVATTAAEIDPSWADRPTIHCLLYYHDPKGRGEPGYLVGILNHYPEDFPPLEKAGSVNVWVKPNMQGRGFARILWLEGVRLWDIDWRVQRYTPEGASHIAHHYGPGGSEDQGATL